MANHTELNNLMPKAFVTGYPVGHSRSPLIHRYWLDLYHKQGTYEPLEVAPQSFEDFIISLKAQNQSGQHGFCGGNVTLPHKEQAFAMADRKDTIASMIGAANTLWFEDNVLCATNTDVYGFCANLDEFAPDWAGGTALVLGAGGASRAILYALKMRGFERIILLNRTIERADELALYFGAPVEAYGLDIMGSLIHQADLIVNTTSLGMESHTSDKDMMPLFDFDKAKPSALVTDIVYTPLITPFLRQAHGLKTVDGLGMLLHQAVPGFEKWFGIKPVVTKELRDIILSDLGER